MTKPLIEQYKDLWQTVFDDGRMFVEQYFKCFVNEDSFYYIDIKGELVSALTATKYKWRCNDREITFAYLSGILTKDKFRKQGYCERLIKRTLDTLAAQNVALSGLIAADSGLKTYYNRFGFVQIQNFNTSCFTDTQFHPLEKENSFGEFLNSQMSMLKINDPNVLSAAGQ